MCLIDLKVFVVAAVVKKVVEVDVIVKNNTALTGGAWENNNKRFVLLCGRAFWGR